VKRFCYHALWWLILPLVLAKLLWRGFKERGYWQHIAERFGFYPAFKNQPLIWIHAVSLGETRAAALLIPALLQRFPNHQILLSCMTATGRQAAIEIANKFSPRALICFAPYDSYGAPRRFIRHFAPRLGVVMETEIWPNMVEACYLRHVPLVLANARLSEKSLHGYQKFGAVKVLIAVALSRFHSVIAQADADATRLRTLCPQANIVVAGNIKFDALPDVALIERGLQWKNQLAPNRMVLLCASTREGEEALILAAYAKPECAVLRARALLVIVPRHPQRFDAVARLIEVSGLRLLRRSAFDFSMRQPEDALDIGASSHTEVLLGDSMGELYGYYSMCDVAFIGGSLVPTGGQNLIEAAACAKPILMGQSQYNFAQAAVQALSSGAMHAVESADALCAQFAILCGDADQRRAMALAAQSFAASYQGATLKTVEIIDAALGETVVRAAV
jgi:3-deoxy-D-manno-octulosonic-acid transferase